MNQVIIQIYFYVIFLSYCCCLKCYRSLELQRGICLNARGFGSSKEKEFLYSGKVRPGALSSKREVPIGIKRPDYANDGIPKLKESGMPWEIRAQTPEVIEKMRIAGRIAREVLDAAVLITKVGISTDDIDRLVHEETIKRNAYPSPLNYHKFPKSCCTSINEVICHGIPSVDTILKDGDIVNIDVTCFYDGVHGDCSETVFVGKVSDEIYDLVYTTYTAFEAAISYCKPGMPYNGIGGIIEDIIAKKGYSTVKEFCGHGIGKVFHSLPNVLHYKNNQRSGIMSPGHTFTIEPMICLGSNKPLTWPDEWTATTTDGLSSAQFEHTLLITEDGVEKLTKKLPSSPKYAWEI